MAAPVQAQLRDISQYQAMDLDTLRRRIWAARRALGSSVTIMAHHYQNDQIMEFADFRGDSLELSRLAQVAQSQYIVFCGVDFMAESAAILAQPGQAVILPAGEAVCPMAAMVGAEELVFAFNQLEALWGKGSVVPLVYQNSSAQVKSFCGNHGGAVCTSSNAKRALAWARRDGKRVLFAPDQYLAVNSANDLGLRLEQIALWSRHQDALLSDHPENLALVAWDGYCSVHRRFTPQDVADFRAAYPGAITVVHPECAPEVVQAADASGSTAYIIDYVDAAPARARIGVGTEVNLVLRLAHDYPNKLVAPLRASSCAAMARTDLPRLCFALERLVEGEPVHVVEVAPDVAAGAALALAHMLEM